MVVHAHTHAYAMQAAPGSLEALAQDLKHQVDNDQPTAYGENDQPVRAGENDQPTAVGGGTGLNEVSGSRA